MRGTGTPAFVCGSRWLVARANATANHFLGWVILLVTALPAPSNAVAGWGWYAPVRRPPSVPGSSGVHVLSGQGESPLITNGPFATVPPGCTMRKYEPP